MVRARSNLHAYPEAACRALLLKTCCITYKNICICQKKVVPLHHER